MDFKKEAEKPLVTDEDRVEVIMLVVDNDRDVAADCTSAILKYTKHPFKLTIYENSLNSFNTAKIWNKLVKESTCGYVCLIDSDADPRNDFVSLLYNVLRRRPEAAAVGPAGDATSYINDYHRIYDPNREEVAMYDNLSGFCFMFRKSTLEEYGYFDEKFVFYGQDSEWTFRMSLAQKVVYVVPKAYVNHKTSVSSSRRDKEPERDFSRIRDVDYAQQLMSGYRNVDYKNYNPWKNKLPYRVN